MAFINPKKKEVVCKVVYAGAPFSGKTSSLHHLYSHLGGKKQGVPITFSDESLFFDFIPLSLGTVGSMSVQIHLYTLPPQKVYATTCKMILKGVDGLIYVVDSQVDKIQESYDFMNDLQRSLETEWNTLPLVIQYNKHDLARIPTEKLQALFNPDGHIQAFETIATEGKNIIESFQSLAKQVLVALKP